MVWNPAVCDSCRWEGTQQLGRHADCRKFLPCHSVDGVSCSEWLPCANVLSSCRLCHRAWLILRRVSRCGEMSAWWCVSWCGARSSGAGARVGGPCARAHAPTHAAAVAVMAYVGFGSPAVRQDPVRAGLGPVVSGCSGLVGYPVAGRCQRFTDNARRVTALWRAGPSTWRVCVAELAEKARRARVNVRCAQW